MAFPLWGTIKSYILGSWSWLDDPFTYLWDRIKAAVLSSWTWLDTIHDEIWWWSYAMVRTYYPWLGDPFTYLWDRIKAGVLSGWPYLNTIDDRIRDTVSSTWTNLNTLDDRIKDLAWSHIAPKLGDWFWSFIVLEVTLVSKIGYRVLSTLWNMEWDDANKEAK